MGVCGTDDRLFLGRLLDRFASFNGHYEFLIVLSGVDDSLYGLVLDRIMDIDGDVIFIREGRRKGKVSALNLVLGNYSGDFLVHLPADVLIAESSIEDLVSHLRNGLDVVSGHPVPYLSRGLVGCLVDFVWRLHNHCLSLYGDHNVHVTGELMGHRHGVISHLPVGLINDDSYVGFHARRLGYRVGYSHFARVLIDVPMTIGDYIVQRRRILLGHYQLGGFGSSTTFRDLWVRHRRHALRLLLSEIHGLKDFVSVMILVVIELLLGVHVRYGGNSIWRRISGFSGRG